MPPEIVQSWAAWVAALVAGLAALGWLLKKIRAGYRRVKQIAMKIERLDELASYELKPNGGGSIKDRVLATQQTLDQHLKDSRRRDMRQRNRDARTLKLLGEHAATISRLAEALPVVARSTPDATDTQEQT